MQLGMQTGASVFPGVNNEQAIEQLSWQAKFADDAGFKRLWLVEHHFVDFALSGAPTAILAHYATITKNIKLGYAVAVVPLHHPVRLAEEMVWVDQLSHGRLMAGIGPGFSPLEYGVFGVPVEKKREYLAEAYEILKRAVTGEQFAYNGEIWQIPEVQIYPAAYQGRQIPFYMATSSDDSVARAARWGVNPLLGFRPVDVLKRQIALWRGIREEMGDTTEEIDAKQKEIGVLRRIVVADSEDEAQQITNQGSLQFADAIKALNTKSGDAAPRVYETLLADGRKVMIQQSEAERAQASAQNAASGTIAGTKQHVIEQLYELQETGVGHVLGGFGGRGVPHKEARENLEMVARDILPLFND